MTASIERTPLVNRELPALDASETLVNPPVVGGASITSDHDVATTVITSAPGAERLQWQ